MTWQSTDFPGITCKPHETRKHGVQYDKYFRAQYQVGGKRKTVGFGWMSEGWTAKKVFNKVQQYRHNAKVGKGPTTLKEEREQEEERRLQEEEERRELEKWNITFNQFFEEIYLPLQNRKKEKTLIRERGFVKKWIDPQFGHKYLKDITVEDLEDLQNLLYDNEQTPRSVQYCLAVTKKIFNLAINKEYISKNPVGKIKLPTKKNLNNERDRFLSKEEADKLLQEVKKKSQNLYEMSLLSLHTGMRASEIFNLKWNHVDFENGIISVREGKGNKDRKVYLTQKAIEVLQERKKDSTTQLVFTTREGEKIQQISKAFRRAVDKLGLNDGVDSAKDKVVFHTWRHTFASWQVQAGMSLYELQRLLGHESFEMVQRYAHLAPENLQRATAIFDQQETTGKVINGNFQ